MFTGGSSQATPDAGHLRANFDALRLANGALREASVRNGQTAAHAREQAARITADSKRLRGELIRAWLPREATCGALARRLVERLDAHPAEVDDVMTVVSELVNDAYFTATGRSSCGSASEVGGCASR